MTKTALRIICLNLLTAVGLSSVRAQGSAPYGYLQFSFLESSSGLQDPVTNQSMRAAFSSNGSIFGGISLNSVYNPGPVYSHILRDPALLSYVDTKAPVKLNGLYYACYTNAFGATTTFNVISSPDLIHWTQVAAPSMSSIGGTINRVWSPKMWMDSGGTDFTSVKLIVGADNSGVLKPYYLSPANAAMTSWSSPALMAVSDWSSSTWGDPGTNTADFDVVKVGATYHFFMNRTPVTGMSHSISTALTGPYSVIVSTNVGTQFASPEGICVIPFANGSNNWRMYVENWPSNTGIQYCDSADLNSWTSLTYVGNDGYIYGHGTVSPILDAGVMNDVRAAMATATPDRVTDGSGQTNFFKYIAGLTPFDSTSRFTTNIQPADGQPGQIKIVFNPVVSGHTYNVQYKNSLSEATWITLSGAPSSDSGSTRTVTDTGASGHARFYRVQVSMP
jgi:hypothetical protein